MRFNYMNLELAVRLSICMGLFMLIAVLESIAQQAEQGEKPQRKLLDNQKIDGYRGIWWFPAPMQDRPQSPSYGSTNYKYSGPLSFAWPHTVAPMAVYAPEVNKTFFVYGGDTGPENRYLLAMVSYYDHDKHLVPKPTVVRDQRGIDDPDRKSVV